MIRLVYIRDDRLGCFQNLSGPESEKLKKKLCKIFIQSGLSVAVECNLQITDFLNVTFDLRTDKYYPNKKDNNQILYINKQSNHPPTITKQIPSMVSRRIFDMSCNKEYFDNAVLAYNNALKISDFNENIKFKSTPPPRRNRNRKIIWFHPLHSVNVKTNISGNTAKYTAISSNFLVWKFCGKVQFWHSFGRIT